MKPLEEVRDLVLAGVRRLGNETVSLAAALGRILVEPVTAPHAVPHFANSAMDGFAVRAGDVAEAGATLRVVGEVAAGRSPSGSVGSGQAMKIMTGAPVPEGADTVVRVEDTSEADGFVQIDRPVGEGTHVRRPGTDLEEGDEVFSAGTRLSSTHVGVLATIGVTDVVVSKVPTVAVMSTGDELADASAGELAPGLIRDSNRPMLLALLAEAGVAAIDVGAIGDDADLLRAAVGRSAVEADAIVTTGGVSMGAHDLIKLVLGAETGVEPFQIAMKPGKPFAFGPVGGTPLFGLPGNPVSVLVAFMQLVRPALLSMQGARAVLSPRAHGVAGERMQSDPEKEEFVRARLVGGEVVSTGRQGSHVLSGAAHADLFAVFPVGSAGVDQGADLIVELFRAEPTRAIGE